MAVPAKQTEEPKKNLSLRDFEGVNTQSGRQTIADNEFSWLENVMPIGHGNLKAVLAPSVALATLTGETCYFMQEGNIANVSYMFMFCASGAAYQVNLAYVPVVSGAGVVTTPIASPGLVNWTTHGLVANQPFIPTGTWPTGVTVGQTYYVLAAGLTANVFEMSATIGGAAINFSVSAGTGQVITTSNTSKFATAGTFSASGVAMAQWKNERIVIIDPANGYFDWNGSVLTTYKGTIATATITAPGINYTSSPTITPASGSATFSSIIGANLATLVAAGTGYAIGDVLTIAGGTFTLPATITVSAVTGGAISGFNLTTPGAYTASPANAAAVTGGHGASATFTMVYGLTGVTVVTPGTGYTSAPLLTVSGGGGTLATATANMNITISGSCIAVYSGRVWIAFGRTVIYSAPGSYSDFSPVTLGGSFIMTDDTLKSVISKLFSANNYLYIFGASSINIITNVTVTNPQVTSTGVIVTPSVTAFSNTNISPSIGTDFGSSVVAYFKTVAFAVDYGFMGLTGSTPQKSSDKLDGIFPSIDFTQSPTGGLAVINSIMCLCFLVKYVDPVTAVARPLICVFFNNKWFFASQGAALTFVASASPDPDVPSLWGTDGSHLYKLFSNTTATILQTVRTKLWDAGDPLKIKQTFKIAFEAVLTAATSVVVNLDTEISTSPYSFNCAVSGYYFSGMDASSFGNYTGLTLTCTNPGAVYQGLYIQYENRGGWIR